MTYRTGRNCLQFCQMHTRSLNIRQSGFDSPIDLPPVPMEENYVCAWAALHNQIINVEDVNTDKRFDFSGAARYDIYGVRHSSWPARKKRYALPWKRASGRAYLFLRVCGSL